MFWSRTSLDRRQSRERLISPYRPEHLEESAYAMGVASQYAITSSAGGRKVVVESGNITIPPGQFALLLTEETVKVPDQAIAFISMKAKWKFRGLVNVSGFHVDPGFEGRLKFSVYNAGASPIDLKPGDRVFLIWYSTLDEPTTKPYQAKDGQNEITSSDVDTLRGIAPSVSALATQMAAATQELATVRDRLTRIEVRIQWVGIALGIFACILMCISYALGRATR